MINFIMYLFGSAAFIFLLGISLRYGLKGAGNLDSKISRKLNSSFNGFNWYFRIPFSIGVIPEYYFYLVLGANNYFKTNWWALRTSAYITFLLFLALLTNRNEVELYYSLNTVAESGFLSLFTSGITFWYLNLLNLFYITVFVLISIESIRMQKWYAPVRIFIYSFLSFFMSVLTIIVLSGIILVTVLYVAYKIIKFFFFSSNKQNHDNEDVSGQLNNNYRRFRAELYDWESEYKSSIVSSNTKRKKTTIKRKRVVVERKPKPKPKSRPKPNDDTPRFYPD